ncbi:DUF3489 domain-containing protein [Microvirga pudoricolor]|uniref:DUF3489 domain-containing protein n=1 Tax=Microvirga pudoricolor TaxID=2778729 RepID=UPI0019504B0B|nr:DUF3489 domain-containing protein [Microvirga pudoricolor]MBM6595052.1 DUF3489 domain-containing protein [Microvirga pudoricolor]
MTLTDTQLLLLSHAAQRSDLLLSPPPELKLKAAQAATAKLLRCGYVDEVTVERDQPHWREEIDGHRIGFQVAPAGLQAIGIETEDDALHPAVAEPQVVPLQDESSAPSPKPGTKKALIRAMLEQEDGASLRELASATGWLPHTTRACLTRLRQAGVSIVREPQPDGLSLYRIIIATEGAAAVDEPARVTA